MIFFNNVNRKINSGQLASAMTSGKWRDRVLGLSEMVDIPIRGLWIIDGNNVKFSHEMIRRNVPIRLDAAVPSPERRAPSEFKHHPLQDWAIANRPKLVWACHVLIKNWVDQGMRWGSARMASFDVYAGVMSGIFEAARLPGFLGNVDEYRAVKDDDATGIDDLVEVFWDKHKCDPMSVAEMIAANTNEFGGMIFELPVSNDASPHRQGSDVGRYLTNEVEGGTFDISASPADLRRHAKDLSMPVFDGEEPTTLKVRVRVIKCRERSPAKYRIVIVRLTPTGVDGKCG